jgi:HEPN domain-containing protein
VKKKKASPEVRVPDDPKRVFRYGEMYRRAHRVLQINQITMPSVVCAALSLELYFKALIVDEKGDAPDIHDLQVLFSLISPNKQQKIRDYFNLMSETRMKRYQTLKQHDKTPPLPTFERVLDSAKRIVVTFRYGYRTSVLNKWEGWFANEIWDGARKLILELHPDWATP